MALKQGIDDKSQALLQNAEGPFTAAEPAWRAKEGDLRLFVPGRVCLFGEHSDWAGAYRTERPELEKGRAIIAGTDQGIHAEVEPHPSSLVLTSTDPDGASRGPHEVLVDPETLLREAREGGFWSYVAGTAYQVQLRRRTCGLVIRNDHTDLPVKKGLSSSAAICVLTARAFDRVYELDLSVRDEMEIAYYGEMLTPSRCGRMDQGCAYGNRVVSMEFDGDRLDAEEIPVGSDLHLVLVDLCSGKDTIRILEQLHRTFRSDDTNAGRELRDLLGPINRRIVRGAAGALAAGDGERLGALMTEAQRLFDHHAAPSCPDELTAPALHRVLGHRPLQIHIWGGKGVGSQGDGSAQLLARGPEDQEAIIEIVRRDFGMPALKQTIRRTFETR